MNRSDSLAAAIRSLDHYDRVIWFTYDCSELHWICGFIDGGLHDRGYRRKNRSWQHLGKELRIVAYDQNCKGYRAHCIIDPLLAAHIVDKKGIGTYFDFLAAVSTMDVS